MRRLKGLAAVVVAFASLLAVGQENAWGQVRYTVTDLGTLGGPWSEAFGINASGQVVGWSDLPTSNEYWGDAFLYSNGTMTDLAWRGVGGGSQANGINASGQIVGQSSVSGDGFLYSNGTLSDVPPAAGCSNTQPLAINDSGQVVGWADTADGRSTPSSTAAARPTTWTPCRAFRQVVGRPPSMPAGKSREASTRSATTRMPSFTAAGR